MGRVGSVGMGLVGSVGMGTGSDGNGMGCGWRWDRIGADGIRWDRDGMGGMRMEWGSRPNVSVPLPPGRLYRVCGGVVLHLCPRLLLGLFCLLQLRSRLCQLRFGFGNALHLPNMGAPCQQRAHANPAAASLPLSLPHTSLPHTSLPRTSLPRTSPYGCLLPVLPTALRSMAPPPTFYGCLLPVLGLRSLHRLALRLELRGRT